MGEKGESFTGTSIKDTWTTTREGGNRGGRWGGLGWRGGVGGKAENYVNNNKNLKKKKNDISWRLRDKMEE